MKKVGFIIPQIGGGGAEKVIVDLVLNLQNDCDITLYTYVKGNIFENDLMNSKNIKYITLDINKKNTISKVLTVRKILKNNEFDSFISFLYYSNIVAYLATLGLRKKPRLILSERGNPLMYLSKGFKNIFWKYFLKSAYQNCDYFIPNSIEQGQNIRTYFKLTANNMFVIQNSIDTTYIDHHLNVKPVFTDTIDDEYIIAVGRLVKLKNHKGIINAFNSYIVEYPESKLKLYIVGQGALESELANQINSLGLNNRVKLLGFIKHPYHLIEKAKGYIQNSDYEGFPNALLEGLYINGVAASSNCQTGPKEMIVNNINGILYEVNDQKALINAIKTIDTNHLLTSKMKIKNKTYIKQKFDIGIMLKKYRKVILE